MKKVWVAVATSMLVCGLVRDANAQKSGGIALILMGGYGLPGTLAEDAPNDWHLKASGALLLGGQVEIGISKTMGLDFGVNRTISQTLTISNPGFAFTEKDDMSMTQFTGSLVIRPSGRRPNGAVTPFFIELGGGVTMYSFGSAANPANNFKATKPMGFAGLGYNVPIGPRATIQLFGRAQAITAYSSTGLDQFNALPPVSNVKGKLMLNFQFGAALRVGR